MERSGRQGAEEIGFGFGEMEPVAPVLRLQHHDLAVVDGGDVGAGGGGEHSEGRRLVALLLPLAFCVPPKPGDAEEGGVGQREAVLGLGVFLSGELEEGGGRDEAAAALRKTSAFRANVEHRPSFFAGPRREAEAHGRQRHPALAFRPHHRGEIADPHVIRLGEIRLALMRRGGKALLLQRAEVFGIADVLFVVVAHGGEVGREGKKAKRLPFQGTHT